MSQIASPKKPKITKWILLVVLLLVLGAIAIRPPWQERYEGRTLNQWIKVGSRNPQKLQVYAALKALGGVELEKLRHEYTREQTSAERFHEWIYQKFPQVGRPPSRQN